jgi:3-O-methylgallate 3,4-dioxygenase
LIDDFPDDLRVGIMASGGLSHFLVNEELDHEVIEALQRKDHAALKALPAKKLLSGSSEIRNWIAVAAAVEDLKLDWIVSEGSGFDPLAVFGSIHATCLSALVADRAMETW